MDQDEVNEYMRTVLAFANYANVTEQDLVTVRRNKLESLPENEKIIAGKYLFPLIRCLAECIVANSRTTRAISQLGLEVTMYLNGQDGEVDWEEPGYQPAPLHESKAQSTLRQIAREWSSLGEWERATSYNYVLAELAQRFPTLKERNAIKVVCPGSGLGRLPFEIAKLGFKAEGNEFSTHMHFTGQFIMNTIEGANMYTVHPYIHKVSGTPDLAALTIAASFPDVDPRSLLDVTQETGGELSMTSGEFLQSYPEPNCIQALVTMFFLDTSHNIFNTVAGITRMVEPGGVWINFGPFLWHYEGIQEKDDPDAQGEPSGGIELTTDHVLQLIEESGWVIEKHQTAQTTYCTNPRATTKHLYDCEFFVAVKKS